jgi:AmmeMemoRadiSam system protein B
LIRPPAVAGRFYPGEPADLGSVVESLLAPSGPGQGEPVVAALVPHAGYVYSGGVAGRVYAAVRVPERVILLGPNHTGKGPALSLWERGVWGIPGKEIPVDEELGLEIRGRIAELQPDRAAHVAEHCLEVQLPFLAARAPRLRVTPLVIGTSRREVLSRLAGALAGAIRACGEEVLLILSSDMTHYEPAEAAQRKDRLAIAALEALDDEALERVVHEQRISMCGYAPALAGILAARELGARSGRLVRYEHSGSVSGDLASVVGYAGMTFS